jgi:YVTN family beta-propeller protein
MKWLGLALLLAVGCGGSHGQGGGASLGVAPLSSSLALTSDDAQLWVVNADSDSVSLIDAKARTLVAEIALGAAPPAVDPTTMRFDPAISPRALAILPGDAKVYVAGQRADTVFVIDAKSRAVVGHIAVGAAPVGVVAAADGKAVYVVSHEAATVTKIDPTTDTIVATLPVAEHPWGASLSADGKSLFVTHLLLHAGMTVIDTATFTVRNTVELADQPADAASKLVPNGQARGVYMALPRPGVGGGDIWLPHLLLATGLAQPDLDFDSTAFPTISTFASDGVTVAKRLLFKPLTVPGATGRLQRLHLGAARAGVHARRHAGVPGRLGVRRRHGLRRRQRQRAAAGAAGAGRALEGIVVDSTGKHAFIDGRNTHNVIALSIVNGAALDVAVDGAPIERLMAGDPMPMQLRLGQRLFYTANSSAFPITQNFWIACATCHLEGGSDAVTWKFAQGPRDTPSNAGGPINTGFLMRQALRNNMEDYDVTIRTEQGGLFHRDTPTQLPYLDELGAYTNFAIPLPNNPNVAADGTLTAAQARGQATFGTLCASCHTGAFYTDSGAGNPTLDMTMSSAAVPILLHDVGTCVTSGPFNDQPHKDDVVGMTRTACDFDTPTLRGIFATAPYFHDGSAATLDDVVARLPFSASLAPPIRPTSSPSSRRFSQDRARVGGDDSTDFA